ncbi:MAG TPA: alpha/beta hydrolase [Schlesneria sp.]|jgi:acetyl esterase
MPLHPQAAKFLNLLSLLKNPSMESLPLDVTRRALILGSAVKLAPAKLARVETRSILGPDGDELQVRIYWPIGTAPSAACLYFHGGGWVLNNIDTHDDLVQRLAQASGCVFISVDYRLAPEHKYPAAVEDAYVALNWVVQNASDLQIDPARVAVSGDSAGGNIAAALCLMARDRGGPAIAFQALIYPITDCDFDRPSYRDNADGYFLTTSQMQWFWNHYVQSPEQMREPYASPLRAESLQGLPPALILTAEFDPLRDEGEAYAIALSAAGAATELVQYDGMIHAFIKRVDQFDTAVEAINLIGDRLKSQLAAE